MSTLSWVSFVMTDLRHAYHSSLSTSHSSRLSPGYPPVEGGVLGGEGDSSCSQLPAQEQRSMLRIFPASNPTMHSGGTWYI
jgi:hypothetical protein